MSSSWVQRGVRTHRRPVVDLSWECRYQPWPVSCVDNGVMTELGSALRGWRDRLSAADAGLPITAYRRAPGLRREELAQLDRKSTRLNSSHLVISYAVFCL